MTLEFATLNAKKDGTYHVYIRYFFVNKVKKKYTTYLQTDIYLYPQQFEQLKNNTLSGNIYKELQSKLINYRNIIETYHLKCSEYPAKEDIVKKQDIDTSILKSIHNYYKLFLTEQVTSASRRTYRLALDTLLKHIDEKITYYIMIDKDFLQYIKISMVGQNYTESYITYTLIIIRKFLNYIADELDMPLIETKIKSKSKFDHYHLTEDDINRIIFHHSRTKHTELIQDMVNFNKQVGLRISELCNIKIDNVVMGSEYHIIKVYEKKKKRHREVPIIQNNSKWILHNYWTMSKKREFLFPINKESFMRQFRKILKEIFREETVTLLKTKGGDTTEKTIPKYKAISNHAFRRYAITSLSKKYGLEVARQYSAKNG